MRRNGSLRHRLLHARPVSGGDVNKAELVDGVFECFVYLVGFYARGTNSLRM